MLAYRHAECQSSFDRFQSNHQGAALPNKKHSPPANFHAGGLRFRLMKLNLLEQIFSGLPKV
jgi:hypothetical protein